MDLPLVIVLSLVFALVAVRAFSSLISGHFDLEMQVRRVQNRTLLRVERKRLAREAEASPPEVADTPSVE